MIGLAFPVIFGAGVVSLILRFRRSTGVERQQIKWVVFGLVVALVGILATSFSNQDTTLSAADRRRGVPDVPASRSGSPILRFHLYDLDVVVRKTLIYGAFALFATLIYLALVVGVGALARPG